VTDGINTEVISGLDQNDIVIERMAEVVKNAKPAEKSPFVPQRGGGGGGGRMMR
jgi:hypothetical protein